MSGMSEKAYNRSFNSLQNSIGFKYEFHSYMFKPLMMFVLLALKIGLLNALYVWCNAGINWILENWGFSLDVLGLFLLCRRDCLCKFLPLLHFRFNYCLGHGSCNISFQFTADIVGVHHVFEKMPWQRKNDLQNQIIYVKVHCVLDFLLILLLEEFVDNQ